MELVVCPKCERTVRSLNGYHYCEKKSIDGLFFNKPDHVLLAFDRLLDLISPLDDVKMSATKNCIVFVNKKTFLVAKPMTKFLQIKFYSQDLIEDDGIYKCQKWNSKFESILRIADENELSSTHFEYFKNSYLIS